MVDFTQLDNYFIKKKKKTTKKAILKINVCPSAIFIPHPVFCRLDFPVLGV